MSLMLIVAACGDDDGKDKEREQSPAQGTSDAAVEGGAAASADGAAAAPRDGAAATADAASPGTGNQSPADALPIVFIHGFAGSAQQYDSQAMRFVANGYPADRIRAYEHDGAGMDYAGFVAGADAFIDGVLKEFKSEKVYLVGHSRGTFVSSMYLADPTRAAKVAKYIALDGRPCPEASAVPCLAPNQANLPGQAHVEVSTSAESFARQYDFLLGKAPTVTEIVAQTTPVVISGRAVNFPQNTGRVSTLQVWELVSATGARVAAEPLMTFNVGASGDFGPLTVSPEKHYEFVLSSPDAPSQHHFYPQRFLRSSAFVRLLSGPPDTPTRMNTNVGDKHAALTVSRQREWMQSDVLEISTTSASGGNRPAVNVITPAVMNNKIGLHFHDGADSPGESTLQPLPWFPMQAFQTGLDLFMPAADPPDGTITLRNLPRGDASKPQVLNVPNWASSKHIISVIFSDFPQP